MPSIAKRSPPLSVRGTLEALRLPTAQDLLTSAKASVAVTLALLIGFSQNLDNPYWSALTVYVLLSQPQTGAIRAKGLFRLAGTLLGGSCAIFLAALFANDTGALLAAAIVAVLIAFYAKTLDRTPASYTWFATALTIAVVAFPQADSPDRIFEVAVTRMLEICLGILMIGLVDSLVLPRAATPGFFAMMRGWQAQAGDWAAAVLAAGSAPEPGADLQRRDDLQRLASFVGPLDALCTQLPYDIVAAPPRRQDLRLVRTIVAHLIADLAAFESWIADVRRVCPGSAEAESLLTVLRGWLLERPAVDDAAIARHAERGEALRDRLADFGSGATPWLRLSELADHWSRLEQALHAIATGTRMPPALRAEWKYARPIRSTDYLLGLLDAAPLALGLGFGAVFWGLTAWTSGASAMVFIFISLGFIIGTPGALRSADGIVLWIALTCGLAFIYQFGVLPGVTAFPALIAVLAAGAFPITLLMTMSPAGTLILANFFAFLGLQNTYAGEFQSTVENACGSLVGCIIAVGALYLCQFDRARFSARRLAAALRHDLVRVARSPHSRRPERQLTLSVDRVALYYAIAATFPDNDELRRDDLFQTLKSISNLLRSRPV